MWILQELHLNVFDLADLIQSDLTCHSVYSILLVHVSYWKSKTCNFGIASTMLYSTCYAVIPLT